MAGEPLVAIDGLRHSYGSGALRKQVIFDVSLDLQPGEIVIMTGPSGSGKTTLLNVLCGWERLDAGSMSFFGEQEGAPAELPWDRVAILPQDLALFEELTIAENVRLPARLRAVLGVVSVEALLEDLGLTALASRLPDETSLGEQQRAALARAFVLEPRVLLADEPTAHQDEAWTKAVMRGIRSLASRGAACLVTTHDPDAMEFLDRELAMRDGELHGTSA